jgi:hypothetical protein
MDVSQSIEPIRFALLLLFPDRPIKTTKKNHLYLHLSCLLGLAPASRRARKTSNAPKQAA